jgi:hypothetical protein
MSEKGARMLYRCGPRFHFSIGQYTRRFNKVEIVSAAESPEPNKVPKTATSRCSKWIGLRCQWDQRNFQSVIFSSKGKVVFLPGF